MTTRVFEVFCLKVWRLCNINACLLLIFVLEAKFLKGNKSTALEETHDGGRVDRRAKTPAETEPAGVPWCLWHFQSRGYAAATKLAVAVAMVRTMVSEIS